MSDTPLPPNTSSDLVADLKSLQRRVRALAQESDAIGMLCHDEFASIGTKLNNEIKRVKREAVYDEVDDV